MIFSKKVLDDVKRGIALGRPVRGPFDIQIMPLDYCNLKCGFCPLHVPDDVKDKHAPRFRSSDKLMPMETLKKIVAGLKELGGVERVHITGGEPLLHPNIADMVRMLKRDLGAPHVALVSNGIALKGKIDSLLDANLDRLSVSINSVVAANRAKISPGEGPEIINYLIDQLSNFGKARKKKGVGFALSSVLTRHNYAEVEAQLEFAAKVGAESVTWLPLMDFAFGADAESQLAVNNREFAEFRKNIEKTAEKASRMGIWVGYVGDPAFDGYLKTPKTAQLPCYTAWAFAVFWPDGSVRACCNCEEIMGDVNRQSITEIWHGAKYAELRMELLRPGKRPKGCLCGECGYVLENKEIETFISSGKL